MIEPIRTQLIPVVQRALGDPTAHITDWQVAPLLYENVSTATRALYRVAGRATITDQITPWSVVLKVFMQPTDEAQRDPSHPFFWQREVLLYESGWLADLDAHVIAPRMYGTTDPSDNQRWLWLEDLGADSPSAWSVEQFGAVAEMFGRWGGAWTARPDIRATPWLSHGLIRAWVEASAPLIERAHAPEARQHPLLQNIDSSDQIRHVLALWDEREHWFAALATLPSTLCHHDLWRKNLLARSTARGEIEVVALDWEMAGVGAIGEDVGNVLGVSLLNFDVPIDQAAHLAHTLLDRYLAGLARSGVHADPRAVQAAMAITAALRCVFSTACWPITIAHDPSGRFVRETEQRWNKPIQQIFEHWAATTQFLLDQLATARAFLRSQG